MEESFKEIIKGDGDTIWIGETKIRLHGFNAPEAKQVCHRNGETWPCGKASTDHLILLRKHASEANFKKFAPAFKYIHLASHGQFNSEEPLMSRMLLAPGDGEDGNLT